METEGRIMAHRCRRARNGLLQAQLLSQLPGLHITTQLTAVLGKHSRCTAHTDLMPEIDLVLNGILFAHLTGRR